MIILRRFDIGYLRICHWCISWVISVPSTSIQPVLRFSVLMVEAMKTLPCGMWHHAVWSLLNQLYSPSHPSVGSPSSHRSSPYSACCPLFLHLCPCFYIHFLYTSGPHPHYSHSVPLLIISAWTLSWSTLPLYPHCLSHAELIYWWWQQIAVQYW